MSVQQRLCTFPCKLLLCSVMLAPCSWWILAENNFSGPESFTLHVTAEPVQQSLCAFPGKLLLCPAGACCSQRFRALAAEKKLVAPRKFVFIVMLAPLAHGGSGTSNLSQAMRKLHLRKIANVSDLLVGGSVPQAIAEAGVISFTGNRGFFHCSSGLSGVLRMRCRLLGLSGSVLVGGGVGNVLTPVRLFAAWRNSTNDLFVSAKSNHQTCAPAVFYATQEGVGSPNGDPHVLGSLGFHADHPV